LKDDEYEKILELSERIQKCISDITEAVYYNLHDEDPQSVLLVYSSLLTVTGYFEFKLRNENVDNEAIEMTKSSAEKYLLSLISQELGSVQQKKGDA
jgi:hypothetical protein